MNNRSKDDIEMTSACYILQKMLEQPAISRWQRVSGGVGVGMGGHPVITHPRSVNTYDEDTNALLRAQFACNHDMVVSPLSKTSIFYTTKDRFQGELEEAKRISEEQKNSGWFSRWRSPK